jgi:branched-subunit amino acid aminotransferase/4-amino-4-deoxychorismate lyase
MSVLIDGIADDGALSVFDGAVLRGDGCFEAIRSYGGRPFAFDRHYERLLRSAAALGLDVPPRGDLGSWVRQAAAGEGDGIVRVVLTRGGTVPGHADPGRCVVLWHPLPVTPDVLRLFPVTAPWHPGGANWELAGVKTISYAPNQAASRHAVAEGFDDALLLSREGMILEGPTFSIAWVCDGVVETPELSLGILASVTVGIVSELCEQLGLKLSEGRYGLDRLESASEVMALSTVKEVVPVSAVGSAKFESGPITASLANAYRQAVQASDR